MVHEIDDLQGGVQFPTGGDAAVQTSPRVVMTGSGVIPEPTVQSG